MQRYRIEVSFETAPDPVSGVGVAGAQQFILEKVPAWLEKYGKDTAFSAPTMAYRAFDKAGSKLWGYFVEADYPSPLMGYPGALGLDLTAERAISRRWLKDRRGHR